jgi:hypothetical protein
MSERVGRRRRDFEALGRKRETADAFSDVGEPEEEESW